MKRRIFFMKVFKIILFIFLFFVILAGIGVLVIYNLTLPPKGDLIEYKLNVPSGVSYRSISEELEENNIIKNSKLFYLYSRYKNPSLKSGVYRVNSQMTYDDLHSLLSTGKQEYISVSIPEGLTISSIARILEQKGVTSANNFKNLCFDSTILSKYNIPSVSVEGYLFPDTYYFTPDMPATEVITMMIDNFFTKLSSIENVKDLSPIELHDIVKLASIVEKEYKVTSEAPLIASVFKNRLRYNIGLYSCATIIYIITEELGRPHPDVVRYADLEIESPYNTYKHAGLTPTPISNPGLIALDAAINTPKTNYYFFRVKDETKGTHVFTTDFEDHIEAGN